MIRHASSPSPPALLAASPGRMRQRVKDLGGFQGIRTNQLTGYGVVVGLPGTGDDNLEYTVQSMKGVASRFGLQLPAGVGPSLKNAAVVMITAELPAFAKPGQKLDITVSSMGKAKSLRGGTLIMTPLAGRRRPDLCDGAGQPRGRRAGRGRRRRLEDRRQHPRRSGRIPEGATVERAGRYRLRQQSPFLTFNLARADFTTAQRVPTRSTRRFGGGRARAVDGVSIADQAPAGADVRAELMSEIENLTVEAAEARRRASIVNARTGTVVINSAVRVSPAAVTHGKLTVRIDENQRVSQPVPFSKGETMHRAAERASRSRRRRSRCSCWSPAQARRRGQGGERHRRLARRPRRASSRRSRKPARSRRELIIL